MSHPRLYNVINYRRAFPGCMPECLSRSPRDVGGGGGPERISTIITCARTLSPIIKRAPLSCGAELRSDDDDRTGGEPRPAGGGEGAGLAEGDLGQASLTSCCLKLDPRAPLLPCTWIAYLMLSHQQLLMPTLLPVSPRQGCKQVGVRLAHLLFGRNRARCSRTLDA